mgnify:CR=1 FL=1
MKTYALALMLAASLAAPLAARAQGPDMRPPRISVTGEGEATMAPDIAILTIAVMREAKTARDALTANNDAMAAVIAAMKSSGIAERDLQTTGIQINPRYDFPQRSDGTQETVLVAYQVTNTLSVRIRDIAKTGEVLDKSVSLGVNQGGDISFANENPAKAQEEARKLYVEFTHSQSFETFVRCHIHAFTQLGGVARFVQLLTVAMPGVFVRPGTVLVRPGIGSAGQCAVAVVESVLIRAPSLPRSQVPLARLVRGVAQ